MIKFKELFQGLFGSARRGSPDATSLKFIEEAHHEMIAQHAQHAASWQYGKEKGWTADLTAGVIVFKFANEHSGTSQFQTIGIYNEPAGTFTWGWSHPAVPAALRVHARLAKKWGRQQKHPDFVTNSVKCSMEQAWNYAAVTKKLANADSVYRGRVGDNYIFMTTEEIHIDTEVKKTHWAQGRRKPSW